MVRFHPRLPTFRSYRARRACQLSVEGSSHCIHCPRSPVTLPDGSTKSVPRATTVGDIAASISPRLAQAAYAGMVNGRVVDLTYPLQEDANGPHPHVEGSGGADGVSPQHGASAGRRRDAALSRACSAASGRRPTKASSTTSSSRSRSCRRISTRIEKTDARDRRRRSRLRAPDVAARGGDRVLRRSAASRSRCS